MTEHEIEAIADNMIEQIKDDMACGAEHDAMQNLVEALKVAGEEMMMGRNTEITAADMGHWRSETLHDADLDSIRDQYRRFTDSKIIPNAHQWHLANDLIPDETVQAMADLGTFGVAAG